MIIFQLILTDNIVYWMLLKQPLSFTFQLSLAQFVYMLFDLLIIKSVRTGLTAYSHFDADTD